MYPECILSVCVYPEGYMYLECILMRCISNVSDKPCYISREYMYLDILHVFHTYPKRVQDTKSVRDNKIQMYLDDVS